MKYSTNIVDIGCWEYQAIIILTQLQLDFVQIMHGLLFGYNWNNNIINHQ